MAAPKAAALRPGGAHQNLFAAGRAILTDHTQAIEAEPANPWAALRWPGDVWRRRAVFER